MPPRRDKSPDNGPRRNREIRATRVRLIDETGRQLGIFMTRDAYNRAQDAGLDLVEVSPDATPPVCKIVDFGKMRYASQKAKKEQRRNSAANSVREIKFRPTTDTHDFDTKVRKIRQFISEGSRVKVEVRFRRREMRRRDVGQAQMMKVIEALADVAKVESKISFQGNSMSTLLVPIS